MTLTPNSQESVRTYNESDAYEITSKHTEDFLSKIVEEHKDGYAFTPILGAGISAASGYPLIREISEYLRRCIYRAVAPANDTKRWNPKTDAWPSISDQSPLPSEIPPIESMELLIKNAVEASKDRWNDEIPIYKEARGAMEDWRSSLLFLSRIGQEKSSSDPEAVELVLDAPDQKVLDDLFASFMKDRRPNLAHRMLAVLTGALRQDLILTTNFDEFVEAAFAETRNPMKTFDVHRNETLPHPSAVRDQRYLIKLHGGRHSLRADYSLDGIPDYEEKERFRGYLLAGESEGRTRTLDKRGQNVPNDNVVETPKCPSNPVVKSHLIVMGLSGKDRRIRELLRDALVACRDLKLFWVCYSVDDAKAIHKFAVEAGLDGKDRVHILRFEHPGLLLFQLYQLMRSKLPPHSRLFPSIARLPFPPLACKSDESLRSDQVKYFDRVEQRLNAFSDSKDDCSVLLMTASSEFAKLSRGSARLFHRLGRKNVCLWMDMNDISSADHLFEVLLETMNFKLGIEDWTPCYNSKDEFRPRAEEIRRLVRSSNQHWIVFLNALETPGINNDSSSNGENRPNGWLDDAQPSEQDSNQQSATAPALALLLSELCVAKDRLSIAIIACSSEKLSGALRRSEPTIREEPFPHGEQRGERFPLRLKKWIETKVTTAPAEEQAHVGNAKTRFVYVLALMQRPRPMAVLWHQPLWNHAISDLQPEYFAQMVARNGARWLDELEGHYETSDPTTPKRQHVGLIRRKAGGFIWMNSRFRKQVRDEFRSLYEKEEQQFHLALAGWYSEQLDSSNAVEAVFEIAYHRCKAAQSALLHFAKGDAGALADARRSIVAVIALLRTHSYLIQTRGHSRGSCRRLTWIREWAKKELASRPAPANISDKSVQNRLQRLRLVATEVMRAVAREVGEDYVAYRRHREIGRMMLDQEMTTETELLNYDGSLSDALVSKLTKDEYNTQRLQTARWLRWSGMLGIASRSYIESRKSLHMALETLLLKRFNTTSGELQERVSQAIDDEFTFDFALGAQKARIEMLRCTEHIIEVHTLQELATIRAAGNTLFNEQRLVRWSALEPWCVIGHKLASSVRDKDLSAEMRYYAQANEIEVRIMMHEATWLSLVQNESQEGNPVEAEPLGLLGRAEAMLRIFDPRRLESEIAKIELHRADILLRSAARSVIRGVSFSAADGGQPRVATVGTSEKTSFEFLVAELERAVVAHSNLAEKSQVEKAAQTMQHVEAWLKHIRLTNQFDPQTPDRPPLLRTKALVLDSMRILLRSESVMRESRRNVWWSTWYFERKLRALSYLLWIALLEDATELPEIGYEAAPPGDATTADRMLNLAIRMIRVDSYRLAATVEAYASCTKALDLCRRTSILMHRPYRSRQKIMKDNLELAILQLVRIHEKRKEGDERSTSRKSSKAQQAKVIKALPSKDVARYVDNAIRVSRAMLEACKPL